MFPAFSDVGTCTSGQDLREDGEWHHHASHTHTSLSKKAPGPVTARVPSAEPRRC
jgi:hypothetical protein